MTIKGPYVPLSVNYRESEKFLAVTPLAELLFVRALAFVKGKQQDGLIGERQVRLLTYDLDAGYDQTADDMVGQLVDAGLLHPVKGGWLIEGWPEWNALDSSRAGTLGNHERWHVARGVTSEDCPHCHRPSSPPIAPDIAPDSGQASPRIANREEEKRDTRAADFVAWWSTYPRKVAKAEAEKAYRKARQSASAEQLADGLEAHVAEWRRENRAPEKIPHASTWLNGRRWADELDAGLPAPEEEAPWVRR